MHSGLPGLTEAGSLKDWSAAGRPPPQLGELSVGSVVPHSFVPHLNEVSSFIQRGKKKKKKKMCLELQSFAKESTEPQPQVGLMQHKDLSYPLLAF